MKKHQAIAIVLVIILAIVVGVVIFASKKSTEVASASFTTKTLVQ